jgi:hypothetical protein
VMNDDLSVSFSAEEVQRALFMMHPNKARGPDGFMAGFFSKALATYKGGSDYGSSAISKRR